MLGFPVREFLKDPIQFRMTSEDYSAAKHEESKPPYQFVPDNDWEQRMHVLARHGRARRLRSSGPYGP